jgi:hypothetical protein
MPNFDLSGMSDALTAIKQKRHAQLVDPAAHFPELQKAFRNGIENRRKALEAFGAITEPYVPNYVILDRAFLIRGFRQGVPSTALSLNSGSSPQNNWANFASKIEAGDDFMNVDEVSFFFWWQNENTADAIIDVESSLMMFGRWYVHAYNGRWWSPWSPSSIGKARLRATAELSLFNWTAEPTEPSPQPSQLQSILSESVSGIWNPFGGWEQKLGHISGHYYVHADKFLVPANGKAVFEVTLRINADGHNGRVGAIYNEASHELICPYVQLAIPSAAPIKVSNGQLSRSSGSASSSLSYSDKATLARNGVHPLRAMLLRRSAKGSGKICSLSEVKRTWSGHGGMSAYDPKRTSTILGDRRTKHSRARSPRCGSSHASGSTDLT